MYVAWTTRRARTFPPLPSHAGLLLHGVRSLSTTELRAPSDVPPASSLLPR